MASFTISSNGSFDKESEGKPLRRQGSIDVTVTMERSGSDSFARTSSDASITKTEKHTKKWERSQSEIKLSKAASVERSDVAAAAGNVSEHSQVYWDLSRAVEDANKPGGKVKISLQTIKQKEELGQMSPTVTSTSSSGSHHVSVQRIVTKRSMSESHISSPPIMTATQTHMISDGSSAEIKPGGDAEPQIHLNNSIAREPSPPKTLESQLAQGTILIKRNIIQLSGESVPLQCAALHEILKTVEQAWEMPHYGRDLATGLCDVLREEGGLGIIVSNCASVTYDIRLGSAKVLEQSMTVKNRDSVVHNGLEIVVTMARTNQSDAAMSKVSCGILENLFKHSHHTCGRVINLGGLQVIIQACRKTDKKTLRHCANALANLALYGGADNQHEMVKNNVCEWLFPLAFSDDDSIRYYACLAITSLSANKEMEAAVDNSGTLDLVEPFVLTHSPSQFAMSDYSHRHGRSKDWLERMVPVLSSKKKEAQSLAAFHFSMEAGVKAEQDNKQMFYATSQVELLNEVFHEIGAVEPLKQLAASPNTLAAKFAAEALTILGEEVPYTLSPEVPTWTVKDVQYWIEQIGFGEYAEAFAKYQVDGDLLLRLTEQNLNSDIQMTNGITRMRFIRELTMLKQGSDYRSCDITKLNELMKSINKELTKYTYQMICSGVDRNLLPLVTEENLRDDCKIHNGVDRLKILRAVKGNIQGSAGSLHGSIDFTDSEPQKPLDCFISYRRSNGSQLASLLKVHLQLRGFSVFLDIEKLRAGKFDEGLLRSVSNAKHFIVILTPNALDRCVGDDMSKDWVHREIVAALESGCNIIPVMDSFDWPNPESLPQDMRPVVRFNGIRWIHDYQDACVDKLEKFLLGEKSASSSGVLSLFSPETTASDIHGPLFKPCTPSGSEKSFSDNLDST